MAGFGTSRSFSNRATSWSSTTPERCRHRSRRDAQTARRSSSIYRRHSRPDRDRWISRPHPGPTRRPGSWSSAGSPAATACHSAGPTAGEMLALPDATAEILEPYPPNCGPLDERPAESRLWTALLRLPSALGPYLDRHGHPIRYGYVGREWPVSYYQTVFAMEAGSAEMPSAGRAFTPQMITDLISRGIDVAPVTLHAGVASLEEHEPPPAEFYRVPDETARRVSRAGEAGGRIVAVGTTVVRALETAADDAGMVRGGRGWTRLVVSPQRGVRVVDGLLTGWHEPRASHLLMLEAVAGRELLEASYRAALQERYRWHEFGDLHLVLP